MSNWSNYKMPPSTGGDILKLEDGKAVKVRVVGEPCVFASDYQGKPSTRFALVVFNHAAKAPQILMLPKTAFGMIMDLATSEDWGDPEKYDISITRTGTGKETIYSVVPSPNKKELTKEDLEAAQAIELKSMLEKLPSVRFAVPLSEADDDFYRNNAGTQPSQTQDIVVEPGDEPINLDGIPF